MRTTRGVLVVFTVMFAAVLLAGLPGGALAGEFDVHGFLTQAYAASDGHQFLGIPRSGTTDYRNLAVQLRYAPSAENAFALQLNHERNGLSPVQSGTDVGLDWAFVMHRLGESTEIKVGKTPIPLGIYNEIRAVGTVLPFYRVPYGIYREGSLTSEAVDGVVFSTAASGLRGWRLTMDAYYGGWDTRELVGGTAVDSRVERAIGDQLWIYTPLENVRVGLEAQHARVTPSSAAAVVHGNVIFKLASLDAHGGPFVLQGEYFHATFGDNIYWAAYAHAGASLGSSLSAHAQFEHAHLTLHVVTPGGELTADNEFYDDLALGLNYELQYGVMLKAETHRNRTYDIEDASPDFFSASPAKTRYFIVSAAASF